MKFIASLTVTVTLFCALMYLDPGSSAEQKDAAIQLFLSYAKLLGVTFLIALGVSLVRIGWRVLTRGMPEKTGEGVVYDRKNNTIKTTKRMTERDWRDWWG